MARVRVLGALVLSMTAMAVVSAQAEAASGFQARHSGKFLDVAWGSTAHAADVIQGTCSATTNQEWRFVATAY